jgi:hypothetical protein
MYGRVSPSAEDGHNEGTIAHTYPKRRQTGVTYKLGKCNPPEDGIWKPKHVGELMSTVKTAYNTLQHLFDIFHLIKNARYNGQDTHKYFENFFYPIIRWVKIVVYM